jgi:Histidine kinase/Two component regulator propeller
LRKQFITTFFLLWIFCSGFSQEIFHQEITISEGLPSNSVYDIMQDDKGFIWFATDEGVSRFDGRNFVAFKSQNKGGKSGSFLKKDNFGRIWFENFDGYLNYIQNDSVYKLEKQGNPMGFINYSIYKNQLTYATQNGYEILDLKTLKIIKNQNLTDFSICFIEIVDGKTNFIDASLKTITVSNSTLSRSPKYLNTPLVAPIFTTSNTIYCTDKSNTNKKIYKIENGKVMPLFEINSTQTIQNLYFLQNKFWICTNKGLFVLDKNGKKLNNKPYFANFSITSFFIDNENKYWVGTLNDGVLRFSDFNDIQSDLKEIKPLLLSAENSNLYVGSENGSIYSISNDFGSLKELPLKCKNQILYINNSHPKFNFIAADGTYKTNKNFEVLEHENYALKSIDFVTESEAVVAVSGFIGFINIGDMVSKSEVGNFQYKDKQYHLKDNIRGKAAVWNPIDKEALFLTNMGLLSYKNNRLRELKLDNKKTGFKGIKKANNSIYVLTDDNKLYHYIHNDFKEIKTGLEEITFFKSINDNIYIGNKKAIYHLKNNQLQKIDAIKISEKIQDLQIDKDYFYVLNKKNIIRFNKNGSNTIQNKIDLYLEKIWVNNEDYTFKNKQNLNYSQNDLKFQIAMIDYEKNNAIYYRINNQSWKEILNNGNVLQLSSLSPNQYKIEFSNRKNGTILQKVNFEIQKPFWETLWFFILISILITTIIIFIYYNRLQQIKTKDNLIIDKLKLENSLNENKLKLIKAQMNPHFFFNALNTIQSYIATNETEEATDYLNKFSKLTRMILEMTDKDWITIDEEIVMQTLYLNLQKTRLSDFEFNINIKSTTIRNATIPTMLLQPYIENAVIHGLAHKLGKRNLWVNFEINNQNQLEITIKDNGIGLTKANEINQKNANKNTSFATKATLERLEIINRNDLKIAVETNELFDKNERSEGTEIKITMDLRYE